MSARVRRRLDWRGRGGRIEFLLTQLSGFALLAAAIQLARAIWDEEGPAATAVLDVLVPAAVAVSCVLLVGSTIRRLHDLGLSGAFLCGLLIPLFDVVFFIYLLAARGRASTVAADSPRAAWWAVTAVALGGALLAVLAMRVVQGFRIPSNEVGALGLMRDLVSTEYAYSESNHQLFESRLECLLDAPACIAGYTGPPVLDPGVMDTDGGYRIELHGGGPPARQVAGTSASSTESFAFTACPLKPGRTGRRSFCDDSTGRVCEVPRGCTDVLLERSSAGIRCAPSCRTLGEAPAH